MERIFYYGSSTMYLNDVLAIASRKLKGCLSSETLHAVAMNQYTVQQIGQSGKAVYGINTGFGILANTRISNEESLELQYKILESHSVGVGNMVPDDIVRIMLITKL